MEQSIIILNTYKGQFGFNKPKLAKALTKLGIGLDQQTDFLRCAYTYDDVESIIDIFKKNNWLYFKIVEAQHYAN